MSAVDADDLAVLEGPYVFPDDFLVSEGWPAMNFALLDEGLGVTADWAAEKWLSGYTIVVGDGLAGGLDLFDPGLIVLESVSGELCPVSIITTDVVGSLLVTAKSQTVLNWCRARSMILLSHKVRATLDRELSLSCISRLDHANGGDESSRDDGLLEE